MERRQNNRRYILSQLYQLISELTHLLPHSNFCTDLVFTDQPDLVVDCGIHSLNSKCHHQITKLNLTIEYPCPYEQLVWNYIAIISKTQLNQ